MPRTSDDISIMIPESYRAALGDAVSPKWKREIFIDDDVTIVATNESIPGFKIMLWIAGQKSVSWDVTDAAAGDIIEGFVAEGSRAAMKAVLAAIKKRMEAADAHA